MHYRHIGFNMSARCLYCPALGPFTTVEHPIPESLGHADFVIEGKVCDKCQSYFGREIEGPALCHTTFGFWRSHLGIRTKKGKLPSSDTRPPHAGGAIPTGGGRDQPGLSISATESGTPNIEFYPREAMTTSPDGQRISYRVVLTPWHLAIMGRFLGKMALGAISHSSPDVAFGSQFDDLRRYVREGTTNDLWPFFMQTYGTLDELFTGHRVEGESLVYEIKLPSWGFLDASPETVFIFWIGNELYSLNMNSRSQILPVRIGDPPVEPACIWYSREQIANGQPPRH